MQRLLLTSAEGDGAFVEPHPRGGFTCSRREEPPSGGLAGRLYQLDEDPIEADNYWTARRDVVADLTALLGH